MIRQTGPNRLIRRWRDKPEQGRLDADVIMIGAPDGDCKRRGTLRIGSQARSGRSRTCSNKPQGRLWPGRIRGSFVDWLASPHHPESAGAGDAGGHPLKGREGWFEKKRMTDRAHHASGSEVPFFAFLWQRIMREELALRWSERRRRHQHRARACHYRKRQARPPSGQVQL